MKLSAEQLTKEFGDEYPDAVIFDGIRTPLTRETRFLRYYGGLQVSRFMDGSAQITYREIKSQWKTWDRFERLDFTSAASWLHGHPEQARILRHVMEHGSPDDQSMIALSVAAALPRSEAYRRLTHALDQVQVGQRANLAQAIARTKHPEATRFLEEHLAAVMEDPRLMDPDDHLNSVAYEALCSVSDLIDLGVAPSRYTSQVRKLARHPCSKNIECWTRRLAEHYPDLDCD